MCLVQLGKGCQFTDCDATSRYADGVKAAAGRLSNSKVRSFAARPPVSKDQLCQSAS